jgi:hypothetical protein
VGTGEAQPHRLALVHGEEHPAVLAPALWHSLAVVVDATEREGSQARRQRILAAVVWDAEGPHEPNREPLPDRDVVGLNRGGQLLWHQGDPFVVS